MVGKQNAIQRYASIIKFHGLVRGLRRIKDQLLEIDLYDWVNGTNTRHILDGAEFASALDGSEAASTMHYQPVLTTPVLKPLKFLVRQFPVVGASSCCFLDLGCGRGKPMHVAKFKGLQHATVSGVDLHPQLLRDAALNLRIPAGDIPSEDDGALNINQNKIRLICQNVLDVDYGEFLAPYDVIIVFNKNSFDKNTTEKVLEIIKNSNKDRVIFYIYNNPVFESSFKDYEKIFSMTGWHKNWKTNIYKIS